MTSTWSHLPNAKLIDTLITRIPAWASAFDSRFDARIKALCVAADRVACDSVIEHVRDDIYEMPRIETIYGRSPRFAAYEAAGRQARDSVRKHHHRRDSVGASSLAGDVAGALVMFDDVGKCVGLSDAEIQALFATKPPGRKHWWSSVTPQEDRLASDYRRMAMCLLCAQLYKDITNFSAVVPPAGYRDGQWSCVNCHRNYSGTHLKLGGCQRCYYPREWPLPKGPFAIADVRR